MINESLSKVKCKICDTQFNNEELFKIHVEASHKSSAEFQCDKCDDTFSKKNEMMEYFASIPAQDNF